MFHITRLVRRASEPVAEHMKNRCRSLQPLCEAGAYHAEREGYNREIARHARRRGLTLVELLVVIGVIVILMAIAIPAMRFDMEDRHIREASRAVNAYIVAAQSRAAEKNRPVGIWLERRNGRSGESIRLFTAEVPPPYIGDSPNARAQIQPVADINLQQSFDVKLSDGQSTLLPYLVVVGDVIRLQYKGPYYPITNIDGNTGTVTCGLVGPLSDPRRLPPPPGVSHPAPSLVPYQILRAAQKSSVASIELPKTASIDLNVSGLGLQQGPMLFQPSDPTDDTSPIVIMFSPSGRIDHLRVQGQIVVPQETVHLMVGREALIDQVDPSKNLGGDQIQDDEKDALTNLWVSIGAQTGSVTTQEMATTAPVPLAQLPQRVQDSRKFANQKQLMGGG